MLLDYLACMVLNDFVIDLDPRNPCAGGYHFRFALQFRCFNLLLLSNQSLECTHTTQEGKLMLYCCRLFFTSRLIRLYSYT